MKTTLEFTLALLTTLLFACTQEEAGDHLAHNFKALHGGMLIEFNKGGHGPMIEMVYDEKAGVATLYVFDDHQNKKTVEKAPELLIPSLKGPLPATGKDDKWVFTHEELKKHQHDMRIRITIDGKPYTQDWHPGN